ncbi:Amidohydrolase [Candidatus Desulfarcum epimagneticum]|uniref:Amidohydrolase n=1 Tax=uncultured Desulfobacteraceae bacterium TaxID=218296 RepID=A0A484HIF2_9BACT|nr:Amidohydrolase [uncultured Desulfobacteraceae bacterium]
MIIDCHTHIFPPEIRDAREKYFASESAFKLLYESEKSKLRGARDLIRRMDEQGVDRSVVFGFPWRSPEVFRRHNDYIMEAAARHPGRLIGLGCFDPSSPEAPSEARRCLDAGLSGIGELAFYESDMDGASADAMAPIMDLCRERNAPVLIHANEPLGHVYPGKAPNTLGGIYRFLKRFPENRMVLAHWGGGVFFFHLLKKEVKSVLKNVFFDTAASPFLYDPAIYPTAAGIVGPEKILFGSDYPLIHPRRYFNEMAESGLQKDAMEAILGKNAAAVFGF